MDTFNPDFELEKSSFNLLNFDEFRNFLITKNILGLAISFVIARQLNKFIESIMKNMVDPIVEPDFDNNNSSDMLTVRKWKFDIGPYTFTHGHVIVDFIKFCLVMYLVFVISRLFIDTVN